jgi:phosphate-selective porin
MPLAAQTLSAPPLRADTRNHAQDLPGAEATPSPTPEAVPDGWRRDGLGFKNGAASVDLKGYAQADFRHFRWEPRETDLGPLRSASEIRRFRIGIEAELNKVSLEFVMDPRNSEAGDRLKDATIGYAFSKKVAVLVGHFKPGVSPEFLNSSSKTDLIDRSMAADRLAPDRDWGLALSGELGKLSYEVGGFAGDGASSSQSTESAGSARFTLEPRRGLVLGASFMQGEVKADPPFGSREPSPKGGIGRTPSGFNFWERLHVQGTRRRLGGDAAYSRGPFRIIGEYLQMSEERRGQGSVGQDIPDVLGRGWSVQATWILTGEKKATTIRPKESIFEGGKGALEIAARVEGLRFDDTGATVRALGLNYWASRFLKFQGNALWESYNDPLRAPVPGNKGHYFTLVGRIQLMVP